MSTERSKAAAEIHSLVQGILESEKNANNLVDLLDYLQADKPGILKAAIEGLSTAYVHLIQLHYKWLVYRDWGKVHLMPTPAKSDDVMSKYHDWMRKNYSACRERLLRLLHHQSSDIQGASLSTLMSLIKSEGSTHTLTLHTYSFPNSLLHQITEHLLDNQTDMSSLIDQFREYLTYDDVRFHWMKNIASITSLKLDQKAEQTPSQQFVENAFSALQPLSQWMPVRDEDIASFFAGEPPAPGPVKVEADKEGKVDRQQGSEEGEEEENEEKLEPPKPKRSRSDMRALHVRRLQKHRKHFSDAWLGFLRFPLTSVVHKKVLVTLHSEVMPHLMEPRLLIDFLVDSYDTGGVVSLLALNGLFILMHKYHLDYPDFYTKLYQLLQPSVFHVKYMARFFSLMDTFLSSTHLPLYLVAAFAKKIARLSLSAPPQGVVVAMVFVVNLLKRHPNCKVLLHRKNAEELSLSTDPFLMSEREPNKCRALDSCLWEMKTFQSHYCPQVSSLAKQLLASVNKRVEEDLGKYLDTNDEELMEEIMSKVATEQTIPLNFQEPSSLWNYCS